YGVVLVSVPRVERRPARSECLTTARLRHRPARPGDHRLRRGWRSWGRSRGIRRSATWGRGPGRRHPITRHAPRLSQLPGNVASREVLAHHGGARARGAIVDRRRVDFLVTVIALWRTHDPGRCFPWRSLAAIEASWRP